jgi:septum formation protein
MSNVANEMNSRSVLLASGSPYRRAMLKAAGIECTTVVPPLDEEVEKSRIMARDPMVAPMTMALLLAESKALSVRTGLTSDLVIGADQVLALGTQMFNKPTNRSDARTQLLALSGQQHALHSAVVLAERGKIVWHTLRSAQLTMRVLSGDDIDRYLERASPEIYHSVGAYQIEGLGSQLFDSIDGDYFTIIGLPLLPLLAELRVRGVAGF